MEKLKRVSQIKINAIRNSSNEGGLAHKKYGKSDNLRDYSDREITEMFYGIYRDKHMLLVDGDYFIDMNEVINSYCNLEQVTYYRKPTKEDYKNNSHNTISNIRTFYVKDYFLVTNTEFGGNTEHRITKYLYKIGFLKQGRNNFKNLFSIANDYETLQYGRYPKDLFHPIKRYINGMFFQDDYRTSEFEVKTHIKIKAK